MKRKIREGIIVGVSVLLVVLAATLYSVFASAHIFNASKEQLTEIYGQVRTTFSQSVENRRSLLKSWDQYITISLETINGDDEEAASRRKKEFVAFVENQQGNGNNWGWGFTDFYFISGDETTDSVDSEYSHKLECRSIYDDRPIDNFYIHRSLPELLEQDKGGVVGKLENSEEMYMLFAVPVSRNTYDGFEFSAIGISFGTADMMNLLDLEAFDNKGQFYIALPDGYVLLQTDKTHPRVSNVFDHIHEDVVVERSDLASIRADWSVSVNHPDQRANTVIIKEENRKYYFSYTPVGFGDWMMVGIVPSSEVNGSLNRFRNVTIAVMAAIFAVIIAVVAFMISITEQRRLKEKTLEVQSRENLLDLLTMNANDMFLLFDPDTFVCNYVSPNIGTVLGLDMEDVRNDAHAILSAAVGKYKPFTTEELANLPMGRTWESDIQMRNASDGALLWFRLTLYRSSYDGKDCFVLMFSDRTRERKMSDDLKQALDLAKSANAAKSNFLANMSHDIRTPMNAILGYAKLLDNAADKPARVREYIRKISISGQHLLGLINDVLDMSKIERGSTSLTLEEFDLSELIDSLYYMMLSQAKAKNQSFEVHTEGVFPKKVTGDKLKLNQVLINLLSNAVKYTPIGGHILLDIESKQKARNSFGFRIKVIDDGIGMSEEFVKIIFEPFAREKTDVVKEIQGTGLGMAITKNIIDLMGGTISVESEKGKGSTFTVNLSLIAEGEHGHVSQDEADEVEEEAASLAGMKILAAEDNEINAEILSELLDIEDAVCDIAANGREALEKFEKSEPGQYDMVFMDVQMPIMNGYEATRAIRACEHPRAKDIIIIAMTANAFEDDVKTALESGMNAHLAKPIDMDKLKKIIARLKKGESNGKKE